MKNSGRDTTATDPLTTRQAYVTPLHGFRSGMASKGRASATKACGIYLSLFGWFMGWSCHSSAHEAAAALRLSFLRGLRSSEVVLIECHLEFLAISARNSATASLCPW